MEERRSYDNSLIIAPKERQRELLDYKRSHPSTHFTLIEKKDFIEWNSYRYDSRAEIALLKRGYSYEATKEILKAATRFDSDKKYQGRKINELRPILLELISNGFLYKEYMPSLLFEKRHILISGYREAKSIGKALEGQNNLDTSFDLEEDGRETYPDIHEYNDMVGECHGLCLRIASLLDKGISPKDIYIANYSSTYRFCLSLFASSYGFSIAFPEETPMFHLEIGRTFLKRYEETESVDACFDQMREEFGNDPEWTSLFLLAKTYSIPELDKKDQLALYTDLLKEKRKTGQKMDNAVRILQGEYAPRGSHVFLMDFSLDSCPKSPQNPAYFSENDLIELGFPSNLDERKENETELMGMLRQKEIEWVGYHLHHFGEDSHPSQLIQDRHLNVIADEEPQEEYSSRFVRLRAQAMKDKKRKFGTENPLIPFYEQVPLVPYDNSFKLNDTSLTFNFQKKYSQSGIERYYLCPFSYYVDYILRLPREPSSFTANVGNVFHATLQRMYEPDFSLPSVFMESVEKIQEEEGVTFSIKERALLRNLQDDLGKIEGYIRYNEESILSPTFFQEISLTADLDGVLYGGFADKVITFGGANRYVAVVDYKTYNKAFNKELVPFGINIQLPSYALLLKGDPRFSFTTVAGLYISPIMLDTVTRRVDDPAFFANKIKLRGIFLDDLDALSDFGCQNTGDDYVAATTMKKDGGWRYPGPQLKEGEIDGLIEEVKSKVKDADRRIKAKEFPIHPAKYGKLVNGCEFCKYRKLCFRKDEQINYLARPGEEEEMEEVEDDAE